MVAEHYRTDGSCKCDDPQEQAMMIREWGYSESDFTEGETKGRDGTCLECKQDTIVFEMYPVGDLCAPCWERANE